MNYSFYDEMDWLDDILTESTDEEIFIESIEDLLDERVSTFTEGILNHLHKYVYHASLNHFDILKANALDPGNSFQDIGWSLYTFVDKEDSIGWGVFKSTKAIIKKYHLPESYGIRLSHGLLISKSAFDAVCDEIDSIPKADRVFYVYTIKILPEYTLGFGHSINTNKCITIRNDVIPYKTDKYYLSKDLLQRYCEVLPDDLTRDQIEKKAHKDTRLLSPFMIHDMSDSWQTTKPIKDAIKNGTLRLGDDEGLQQFIKDNNIQFRKPTIRERLFV